MKNTYRMGTGALVPSSNLTLVACHEIQVLSFPTFANSFSLTKSSTLLLQSHSELFTQNPRGRGGAAMIDQLPPDLDIATFGCAVCIANGATGRSDAKPNWSCGAEIPTGSGRSDGLSPLL